MVAGARLSTHRLLLLSSSLCSRPLRRAPLLRLSDSALPSPPPSAPSPAAAPAAAPAAEPEYLIQTRGNKVEVARCGTSAELEAAAQRFGHLPQVCFAGESNAGKSSMLNHLVGRDVARSSSVAGKTRTIDWIVVNGRIVLTDLPGLPARDGQTSKLWDTEFEPLYAAYTRLAIDLRAMLFLHDVRWRVSEDVRTFVQSTGLRAATAASEDAQRLPMLLVLTKDDRVPNADARARGVARVKRQLGWEGVHVHYAATNELPQGRRARRQVLRYLQSFATAPGGREGCAALLDELQRKRQQRDAAASEAA